MAVFVISAKDWDFDKYDAPADLAKKDIEKFLDTLEQNKIISIKN